MKLDIYETFSDVTFGDKTFSGWVLRKNTVWWNTVMNEDTVNEKHSLNDF